MVLMIVVCVTSNQSPRVSEHSHAEPDDLHDEVPRPLNVMAMVMNKLMTMLFKQTRLQRPRRCIAHCLPSWFKVY